MAEVLFTALGSSRLNLRRLNLVRAEIETFIERETKQVERLEFALNKMENDEAYYKGLEKQLERERRQKGNG